MENISINNQSQPAPKKNKKWVIFFVSLVLFIVVFCLSVLFYAYSAVYLPISKKSLQNNEFLIEKGKGVKEIAAELKTENLIRSEFWFETYVWYKDLGASLKAGKYFLGQNLNVPEIVTILSGGKVVDDSVQVTFPEGFTAEQIETKLVESGVLSAVGFKDEIIDGYQVQYKFLSGPSTEALLEGFLFPDTYRFDKIIKKDAIIKRFLDNFDKKITHDLREEINRQGKTIFQTIVLASIIQQEAASEEEMPLISGIFANRLENGIALESDATINYITGKKMRQATINDTKIVSSYNTYLNKGLPPGPICNPGLAAIKAAIYPETTEYLFFFHPLNKPAVFSKTLDEHNENRQKYLD